MRSYDVVMMLILSGRRMTIQIYLPQAEFSSITIE